MPVEAGRALPAAQAVSSRNTEVRVSGRANYTGAPGAAAALFGEGTGGGFGICYRAASDSQYGDDIHLEIVFEQSQHHDELGRLAMFRRAFAGMRWLDPRGERFESYLAIGAVYCGLEVSAGSSMMGGGLYVGAGIEVLLGRAFSAGAWAHLYNFWDDASGDEGRAIVVGGSAGLRF